MEKTIVTRVAFQGAAGAFSEEAIHAWFGADAAVAVPCREFGDVAEAVRIGVVELGMLPVENSIAGSVAGAYDALAAGGLVVVGELVRPIRHFLLGVPGATLPGVRRVVSHPVALAQCGRFLGDLPGVQVVAVYDTAGAAREVAELADSAMAAVAARGAAERYGLTILAPDIQDRDDNRTRFFVVARADAAPGTAGRRGASWKTVILFETAHRSGALVAVLSPFAERGVSLTRIESRPGDAPWHYRFFIEIEGRIEDMPVAQAVADAAAAARSLRVLGSFPREEDPG